MSSTINRLGKKVLSEIDEGGLRSVLGGRTEVIRLGMVGAGRHARANLWPCLSSLPVKVEAVCAAHRDSAERWGQRLGATSFFDSHVAMLDGCSLDAVIACVDPDVHAQVISACLDRKLPLFVEKPAGLSSSQVSELADRDTENSVMVGFQKRFAPAYTSIHNAVDRKRMGGLDCLSLEFGVGPLAGDVSLFMREVGLHIVDLARFFVGELELVSVRRRSPAAGIHHVLAQCEAPGGVLVNLYLSSGFDWANCHERVMASFRRATMRVDNIVNIEVTGHSRSVMGVSLDKVTGGRRYRQRWHPNLISGTADGSSQAQTGFLPELAHFVHDMVGRGEPSRSSLENAALSHDLAERLGSV